MRSTAVVAVLIGLGASCGTPGEPTVPSLDSAPPQLFAVLDPDSATQAVAIIRPSGERIGGATADLVELTSPGGASEPATGVEDLAACQRYGGASECFRFDARVKPGGRYRLTVRVNGRAAVAVADVPGDFALDTVAVRGTAGGSTWFTARWGRSVGGYRYLVNVVVMPPCGEGCILFGPAWGTTTAALAVDTMIPIEEVPAFRLTDPIHVSVAAVSRPLVEFLASGVEGLYPIAPKQNVDGGYGVVGGWVRRLVVLPAPGAVLERAPSEGYRRRRDFATGNLRLVRLNRPVVDTTT